MRLSGAAYGVLRSYDGEHLHMLASRGVPTEYAEFLARSGGPGTPGDSPMPGTAPMQALETRQPTLRLDVRESIGTRAKFRPLAPSPIWEVRAPAFMCRWSKTRLRSAC